MYRFLLCAVISTTLVSGCDRAAKQPLPSPVGGDAENMEQRKQLDVIPRDPALDEPAYHPDEREAILALKAVGATIPLNSAGRAEKIYLARSKKVTDADLVHLKALRDVNEVKLSFTGITDAALGNLAHLERIEVLSLHDTKVTGPGLVELQQLLQLRELYLSKTAISDDGLAHLADHTNLEMLFLSETKITDEGLKYLNNMQQLNYLDLAQTEITDDGLAHLAALKGLRRTSLHQTKVTRDGVKRLRALLPKLGEIHF